MTQAWVIRSGVYGERDTWALQNGGSGGGFAEIPDLTGCSIVGVLLMCAVLVRAGHRPSAICLVVFIGMTIKSPGSIRPRSAHSWPAWFAIVASLAPV